MACRMEADPHAALCQALAEGYGLFARAEALAEADPHDVQRLARRQNMVMAGAGMVGMRMRDERPRHGPQRVDIEVPGRAIEAFRARMQQGFRAYRQGGFQRGGSKSGCGPFT